MSKNSSAKYYQENTERLQKKQKKQSLSKEEKKPRQYDHEPSKNLPEDKKQKLVEYRKKYYKMRKKALL